MLVAFDARSQGSEHVKLNKPLQDFSYSFTTKNLALAFVADGHGGEKYFRSAIGSNIACNSAAEVLTRMINVFVAEIHRHNNNSAKRNHFVEQNLKLVCSKISLEWHKKVLEHFNKNPLTDDEIKICEDVKFKLPISDDTIAVLYGSTLLVAVFYQPYNFWFALQIGDGKCSLINIDNTVSYPIPEDEEQGFGVTKSLCKKNPSEDFRFAFGFEPIKGLVVMTDGMTDSFSLDKLPEFLINIKNNALNNPDETKKELLNFLPILSEQGSGDDVSIAGIFIGDK